MVVVILRGKPITSRSNGETTVAKFVGIKDDQISFISDNPITSTDLQVLEVPVNLRHLSPTELITDCVIQNNQIIYRKFKKLAKDMKVAFVSNHMMACGIATYNQNLFPEIAKYLKEFKLFIEENDNPTGDIYQLGDQKLSKEQVSICWKRGQSLQKLVEELKSYSPDIILINHEFGIFPSAKYWLSLMTQLADFRVIVILHSVFRHKDKTIIEGICPEIIIHSSSAKDILKKEKQINSKVYIVPHGCDTLQKERLWNFYKSNHTFLQCGFSFKYKNFEDSIKAVGLLKEKYPDIFLTLILSTSDFAKVEHEKYYRELINLIKELNIQENVAIIKGFVSDEVMKSYFLTNKVAVFPYKSIPGHEVFGSSGIARVGMSMGMPIISSNIPHFDALPTLRADNPEEIANHLDHLFSDKKFVEQQVKKQNTFIDENSWKKCALQYINIFENEQSNSNE